MLGNVPELWALTLAAMKLGAVIDPRSTLLTPDDLADRLDARQCRAVVRDASLCDRFAGLGRRRLADRGRRRADGWHGLRRPRTRRPPASRPRRPPQASDPLLLYFTCGTTRLPKLVEHTHASYPAGHLSTMYWLGLRPGDVHLNISSPGWAKHAWCCFFAPWNAGGDGVHLQPAALRRPCAARRARGAPA